MGLSMFEQETVITWDRSSDEMILYTADTFLLERLRGLDAYKLVKEYRQYGQVFAAAFVADKKLITIRKGRKVISEEQKAKMMLALQKGREEIDENQF